MLIDGLNDNAEDTFCPIKSRLGERIGWSNSIGGGKKIRRSRSRLGEKEEWLNDNSHGENFPTPQVEVGREGGLVE